MATRNLTMVVNRKHYEDFTERMMDITPYSMTEYSKVNMYLHHDGYPEWQGIQLANWLQANPFQDSARVAAKLVFDHYYDSCYLYNNPNQIDHQYTYIIFVGDGETLLLCYDQYSDKEVFLMTPQEGLLIYTESTADSYDVYACTSEHNGPRDFGSDVFYYCDGVEFAERIVDTLVNNQDVWVADHVWDEIEDDLDCELAEWWIL